MSYSEEFKKKCAGIIAELDAITKKVSKSKKVQKEEPIIFYNIHKRSLPVGLNKRILYRLTKAEADWWKQRLKPKLISYEEHGLRTVHYYDIVRDDGYKSGIYENDCDIMKEE